MKSDNITAYDPKWERGLLRRVTVRTSAETGEVMVILVINGNGIPNGAKLIEMMDSAVYETGYSLESVILNINKDKDAVYGDKNITIAGKPVIKESVCGMNFEISPLSFFQVNSVQMENLYNLVAKYADLKGGETILDLYCGAGTIGLWLLNDLMRVTAPSESTAWMSSRPAAPSSRGGKEASMRWSVPISSPTTRRPHSPSLPASCGSESMPGTSASAAKRVKRSSTRAPPRPLRSGSDRPTANVRQKSH